MDCFPFIGRIGGWGRAKELALTRIGGVSMKFLKAATLMAVLLTCAIMMLGVLSLRSHPVRGGGGGAPTTTLNGDVNCDGKYDITDPIYLLEWMFRGGTAPAEARCPTMAESPRGTH